MCAGASSILMPISGLAAYIAAAQARLMVKQQAEVNRSLQDNVTCEKKTVQPVLRDCQPPRMAPAPEQVLVVNTNAQTPAQSSATLRSVDAAQLPTMRGSDLEEADECLSPSESCGSEWHPGGSDSQADEQSVPQTSKDIVDEWGLAFIAMQRAVRAPIHKTWTRRELLRLMLAPLSQHEQDMPFSSLSVSDSAQKSTSSRKAQTGNVAGVCSDCGVF